jgi:ABC-type uncharacterized transport system YnjBCD ATPase subunit
MDRRHFLTGVAAGVATALAPAAISQELPKLYYFGSSTIEIALDHGLRQYQRNAIFSACRQLGKPTLVQHHMNQICRLRLDNIRAVMNEKDSRQ